MARPKQPKSQWLGFLKDRISVIKATLLLSSPTRRRTSSAAFRLAVIRATTHDPSTPPPNHFVDDLLLLSHHSPGASSAACYALVTRLRKTSDSFVALKCLITLHRLLSSSSHSSFYFDSVSGNADGMNILNLSHFNDQSSSDPEAGEISNWVRWYAAEIEQTIITSRTLGFHFTAPPPPLSRTNSSIGVVDDRAIKRSIPLTRISSPVLIREMAALASMVERLGSAPDSLELQRIALIYEAVKLAGEDYRMSMRELFSRIREVHSRIEDLNDLGIEEFLNILNRIGRCKEKMVSMFLNKKRDDGVWEAMEEAAVRAGAEKYRRENSKIVPVVMAVEKMSKPPRGGRWLDVEWNKKNLTVSPSSDSVIASRPGTSLPPLIEI